MRLPQTAAPLFFCMETGRKFTTFNQTAYPALRVLSSVNRANDTPILQYNPGAQPLWKANALTGQYSARNNPGYQELSNSTGTAGNAGVPGYIFDGANRYVEYDTFASQFNGTNSSVTVCCTVQLASTSSPATQTIWAFGNTTNTNLLQLYVTGGNFVFTDGVVSVTCPLAADTNVHQLTAVRQGRTLAIYEDCRNQSATAGISSPVAVAYNTMTVGALNSNGSVSNYLNGAVGSLLVYGGTQVGAADVGEVEIDLAAKAGVVRVSDITASVGI
jgi:hypothetical protein